jgi:hypothetical protein
LGSSQATAKFLEVLFDALGRAPGLSQGRFGCSHSAPGHGELVAGREVALPQPAARSQDHAEDEEVGTS